MRTSFIALSLALLLASGCQSNSPSPQTSPSASPTPVAESESKSEIVYVAPALEIDKIYPSMKGPAHTDLVALLPNSKELAWITGFKAVIVEADGKTQSDQGFMCHTNLDIASPSQHIQRDLKPRFNPGRLFTISQGQDEVTLPDGFGIPLRMGTPMQVAVQALNLNEKPKDPFKVRHQVTFKYIENSKLKKPLVPLFTTSGLVLKALDKKATHYGVDNSLPMKGAGCLIGSSADDKGTFKDEHGNPFTAHWVVKKGREEDRTVVTEMLALPYDTKIHYILAHVHPFCESLELRDLTTDKSVIKLSMKQAKEKIGLSHTEHFTSLEGIPVFKDHAYEMVSVYNNTSDKDQDAMAVMIMFMRDKEVMAKISAR